MLTVPPNDLVEPLHDRMPAVLSPDEFAAWLDPKARPADLLTLLRPYPVGLMESGPVSERVNAVGADGADLLNDVPEPPAPAWTQPTLFDVA